MGVSKRIEGKEVRDAAKGKIGFYTESGPAPGTEVQRSGGCRSRAVGKAVASHRTP